jgi:predicted amidohydrolase YtcJ
MVSSVHRRWKLSFAGALAAAVVLFGATAVRAQQLPPEVEAMGFADTVFVNGKVVSMDDASASANPGRIYEAIAVKQDRIMKLGTTAEVRALAGRNTKVYDLKGRTLIPGIVEPHQHIYGGATRFAERFGFKFPPDGIEVVATADKDLEKTNQIIRNTIQEASKKVKVGDWIIVRLRPHPEQPGMAQYWGMTRRLPDRKTLDLVSPNNPVLVQPGLRGNVNSAALKILNEMLPGYSASIQETMHGIKIGEDVPSIGWVGSQEMAVIQWEVMMRNLDNNTLAQMLKLVSEQWASIGVTTISTRIPFPKVMSGYAKLSELGQMPIRLAAHYEVHRMPTDPQDTRQFYRRSGVLQGIGGDYMWIDGVASERWDSNHPESCLGPDAPAPAHIKARESCPQKGDLHWDTLQNAIRTGWRMTGVHMCGSESLRRMTTMIDEVINEGTLTLEQVRQQQYSLEHCDMIGKKPDIIDRIKKYNFILSCGPDYIHDGWEWWNDYSATTPNILEFLIPFNTWIKSGVTLVGQHFGGGTLAGGEGGGRSFQPPFYMLWLATTRLYDGKVWQEDERIDRVQAMKMWTRWAANYVRKPNELGSLETGKFADLVILDRDYFTVPVNDILKVRPLMTMVGGKVTVLNASLATEWGVPEVGHQFNFEDAQVEWIGKPFSDDARKAGLMGAGM